MNIIAMARLVRLLQKSLVPSLDLLVGKSSRGLFYAELSGHSAGNIYFFILLKVKKVLTKN